MVLAEMLRVEGLLSHVAFVWGILLRRESVSQWLLMGGEWQPGVYGQRHRTGNRAKFSCVLHNGSLTPGQVTQQVRRM